MKRSNVAIIAVAAIVVFIAAAVTWHYYGQEDEGERFPDTNLLTLDDIEVITYQEGEALWEAALAEFTESVKDEGMTVSEMEAALSALNEASDAVLLNSMLANWDYYGNPAAYGQEYIGWQATVTAQDNQYKAIMQETLAGPNGGVLSEILGEYLTTYYETAMVMNDEAVELTALENAQITYFNSATTLEEKAESYLQLIDTRNQIATVSGYDSYVDYMYDKWYHGYSPDDVATFNDAVSKYAQTLHVQTVVAYNSGSWQTPTDLDSVMDAVEIYADSVDPKFGELYDFLDENGLMDREFDENKLPMTFMDGNWMRDGDRFIYLFINPMMMTDAIITNGIIHEFGHACNMAYSTTIPRNPDIMETHSHGLECLMSLGVTDAVGEEWEFMELATLNRMSDMLLLGCIVHEFELQAYSTEPQSLEDLNAIMDGLNQKYGTSMQWWSFTHLATNPMYIISYGVSALGALDIFTMALDDYDGAVDFYLDVVAYDSNYYDGIKEIGLADPFDPEEVERILVRLIEHVEDKYGVSA